MFRWQRFLATLLLPALPGVVAEPESILIRSLDVYQSMIKGVHDYFNNTCVILFHGSSSSSLENEGMEQMDGLLALQRHFSGSLNVRTTVMDFHKFKIQVGNTYRHIKRPLFVLLNDLEETRQQLVSVKIFGEDIKIFGKGGPMSKWIGMAYPTWLLFLRDESEFEKVLSEVNVPFDCVLLVTQRDAESTGEIVRDVYRIDQEDRLRSMIFGTWNASQGFRGPFHGLYQRRNDLNGRNIRVVSVHDPPISRIVRDERTNRPIGIRGFFGEVLRLLEQGTNCTFTYLEANSWGVRLPNGSWTGSMGMLMNDEADLAASELMMTSDRLDAVKFTTPVYTTKCRAYIKRPDSMAVKWNTYLAPFASNIWNAIAMTIMIATLAILGIEGFSTRSTVLRPSSFRLTEIAFLVFGVFCGQGMEPSPLDPIKLVHLSIHLTAVVVIAAYSAALISYLAIKSFTMPFTTMEGLLEDGTYRFGVIADSADYSFFQNTTDPTLSVMFDVLLAKETDLPVNYQDGLNRVCRENKYAFMTLDNMAAILRGRVDCALEPLDAMMQTTIAMAVPVHSPYRGIFDTRILLLRDSGILQRLLKKEWSRNAYTAKTGWSSVELQEATPLLVFLLLAFLVAALILFAERLIRRSCEKTRANAPRPAAAAAK